MKTNNIYISIIAFMLFFTPLEVLSQSDTVSNITNKHFDSNPSYEYATASTVLTQSDIVTQDILFAPKSPTVAGLAQAIDCPVSYYTGTPEISIPLYTIPLRGLELPINLSYQASGIKVAQEASWVGLGWNLNCAGMITRTVKCGDDFHEYGAGHDNGIEEGYYFAPEAKAPIDKSYFKTNNLGASWLLAKDSEPDVFCYCIPGSSGKFLVDKTRGPILLSCTGKDHVQIKIHGKSVNKSGSFTFEVVDTYGNQYFFELKETTHCFHRNNELNMNYTLTQAVCDEFEQRVSDMYPSSIDYTSSWLLTKIVTSKKQVITFEYEAENYQLPTVESVLKYNLLNTSGNGYTMSSSPQYSCSKTMIEGYHLAKITWDAGSVNFQTTTREDIKACNSMYPLNVPKKLVGLYIKDKMDEIIKSYSFSYKYMNANRTDSYAHVFKRLMLVSVIDNTDKTITSLGDIKKDVCLYPSDKNDNLYKQMTEANIVGIPIESQSYLNEKIISANKTEYGKQGNTYVPFAQYKAEMNIPIDASVLKNAYVKRKDLGHYSSYGNPREIEENHTTTILIWSYLGMYPIAKIKNCSYSELIQYLPESTLNTIEARSVPTENDWKLIEKLRLQLPHAMTMTMEYKPFVGIIRQTDERGFSTYFTYDNSGRLIEEYFYENDKKMILKKYSYHYQTE